MFYNIMIQYRRKMKDMQEPLLIKLATTTRGRTEMDR